MRCAKCGNEVDPRSPECPYCAGKASPRDDGPRARCPKCGSPDVEAVRKLFDPGCGCLGMLLLGWYGLLLGLLGANDIEIVCRNCGYRWTPGPRGGSCLLTVLAAAAAFATLTAALWVTAGILFRGI